MHYATSFQSELNEFLICTPRKKLLKHQLICVKQGLVLVKLGKTEYAVEPGQSFWLPFDTLTSLTMTPNSVVHSIFVSSRVQLNFPKQAGYVIPNELLSALINRLQDVAACRESQIDLLKIAQSELTTLQPKLIETDYTKQVSHWQNSKGNELSHELKLVLRIREANKQMQSGKKRAAVIAALFDGDEALFTNLENLVLG